MVGVVYFKGLSLKLGVHKYNGLLTVPISMRVFRIF